MLMWVKKQVTGVMQKSCRLRSWVASAPSPKRLAIGFK